MAETCYDVIVVGIGSAGGVLASRLSEDPSRRVLALEAGPDFPDEATAPPAFYAGGNVLGGGFAGAGSPLPQIDWGILGEEFAGRRMRLSRGKLVGGTSMINGTIWVRGKPSDFEEWVELGAAGWGWDDVRPFYERVEAMIPSKRYERDAWQPFTQAFADAYLELGYRWVDDMNAEDAWDGVVGAWPQNRRNEIRQGTLPTYVRAARGRPNLTIRADCLVDRVLLAGPRAVGVVLASGEEVRAPLVVVSAGTFMSPAILMRSGIGPADDLRRVGIDCVADLPVGRGMSNHPQCLFVLECPPEQARLCGPGWTAAARGDHFFSFPVALDEEEGLVAVSIALNRQRPDGSVRLVSPDPNVLPEVVEGFEGVVERDDFRASWSTLVALAETDAFTRRGIGGGDVLRARVDAVSDRLGNAFHPASTCAITRVVDERLRVLGIDGLLVADASVFPENISNNLNMTCLMVGERAAAFVADRA